LRRWCVLDRLLCRSVWRSVPVRGGDHKLVPVRPRLYRLRTAPQPTILHVLRCDFPRRTRCAMLAGRSLAVGPHAGQLVHRLQRALLVGPSVRPGHLQFRVDLANQLRESRRAPRRRLPHRQSTAQHWHARGPFHRPLLPGGAAVTWPTRPAPDDCGLERADRVRDRSATAHRPEPATSALAAPASTAQTARRLLQQPVADLRPSRDRDLRRVPRMLPRFE